MGNVARKHAVNDDEAHKTLDLINASSGLEMRRWIAKLTQGTSMQTN